MDGKSEEGCVSDDFDFESGDNERRLKDCVCPQCNKPFVLVWNDYTKIAGDYAKQTLILRGCPSGGIYDVIIACPHCDYEEPL